MRRAIRKAAYFMERGGVFIFDLNTPYKHRHILAGQTFDIEAEDADCHWSNRYDETAQRVDITINIDYHETGEHFHEAFSEYSYALDTVCAMLEKYGFAVAKSPTARVLARCAATARAGSSRLSSNTHKRKKLMEQNHNMLRGISENGGIVFYGVDSTEIVREMERLHKTSAVTTAALGRLLTAASMMGIMLKSTQDSVTLQIKGGGPAGRLLAVSDGTGNVKATSSTLLWNFPRG